MRAKATALAIGVAVGLVGSIGPAAGALAATNLEIYDRNVDGWEVGITNESAFDVVYLESDSSNVRKPLRGVTAGTYGGIVHGSYTVSSPGMYLGLDGTADGSDMSISSEVLPDDVTLSYDSLELAPGWVRFIDVEDTAKGTATVTCGVRNDDITHLGGCSVENRVSDDQPNTVRADEPVLVTFTSLDEGQWSRHESVPPVHWTYYYDYVYHNEGWRVNATNTSSADLFSVGGKHVSYSPQGIARNATETSVGQEYRPQIFDGDIPHNARFDFESLDMKPGWVRFVDVSAPGGWAYGYPKVALSCGISSPSGELFADGCEGLTFDWEKPITVTFTDPGAGPWTP